MTTEAWSAFTNRANLSDNDNAQIMLLDTTVSIANQNQRTPVTQVLRSGMNLSDLGNFNQAVINLGASTTSTPNALMRRDAGGVFSASSAFLDGTTQPTLSIGFSAAFNLGIATANNQFFSGTVNGDVCIRQLTIARQLLLGVGNLNAQFSVMNTIVQSNITHRFPYAGTNRMPFLNGTSDLTASASYTVNGTGGLTITQTLTAANGVFNGGANAVTISGNAPVCMVGASSQYAAATSAAQFFTTALTGDTCIRNTNTSAFINIGLGAVTPQLVISNTQITPNVPMSFSAIGANRMPFTNGTNQLIGNANYTVNGTGGLTITQTLTAAGGDFSAGVSGFNITGTNPSCNVGTNSNYAEATVATGYFSGTIAGDSCIRNEITSNSVHIGVGGATAQQVIRNTEVDFNVGIKLPTSGATAGSLDYYEENVSYNLSMNTPDGTAHDVQLNFSRIGKLVTVEFSSFTVTATTATIFTTVSAIPTKWRTNFGPGISKIINVFDNSVNVIGEVSMASSGFISISVGLNSSNFTNSGTAGFKSFSASYCVA